MRSRFCFTAVALAATISLEGPFARPVHAADIAAEWANVKAPSPPTLTPVTVDPTTTALLMLDFLHQNCGHRPRCMAEIPAMKKLLDAARAAGAVVIYSGFEKATTSDIVKDVAPTQNEPLIHANANKFFNTDLDKMLKDKGIKTVITVGTGANGAVLFTASAAVFRGYNVIVPVDGMSSDDLYGEQITAWALVHATPQFAKQVTLTRSDMVKF